MGISSGRNAPCPCGSGRKYKRCCGASANRTGAVRSEPVPRGEPVAGWAKAHALWPKTRETLRDHALAWLGKGMLDEALEDFWFTEPDGTLDSAWLELFDSWCLYDWIPENETQTVVAHWLAAVTRGDLRRDPEVERMIRSANEHPLSFFQVQAVAPGRGVVLRDFLTHEERFVVDRSLSESAPRWAIFVARLIESQDITFFDTVGPRALPPDWSESVVEWIEENLEKKVPIPAAELRPYGDDVLEFYRSAIHEEDEERAHAKQTMILTNDGEPFLLCTDVWRIAAGEHDAVVTRLLDLGLEVDGEPDEVPLPLVWLEEASETSSARVLGHVRVSTDEVTLETMSRTRRKKLKAKLQKALGRRIRLVRSEETTQEEVMARANAQPDATRRPAPSLGPEAEREVLSAYLAEHYRTWPDVPLPALRGKTPRSAMTTLQGRAEVEDLIRDMEYRTHGSAMDGAYDFDDLRRALGLPEAKGPLG